MLGHRAGPSRAGRSARPRAGPIRSRPPAPEPPPHGSCAEFGENVSRLARSDEVNFGAEASGAASSRPAAFPMFVFPRAGHGRCAARGRALQACCAGRRCGVAGHIRDPVAVVSPSFSVYKARAASWSATANMATPTLLSVVDQVMRGRESGRAEIICESRVGAPGWVSPARSVPVTSTWLQNSCACSATGSPAIARTSPADWASPASRLVTDLTPRPPARPGHRRRPGPGGRGGCPRSGRPGRRRRGAGVCRSR